MNESEDDYESFLRKKRWRKTKDLFRLHEIKVRYPQLNNHVLMEMVWDWLDEKSPKQELVSDVWESSSQFLINVEYQGMIRDYLSKRYNLAYLCRTKPVPQCPTLQKFPITKTQLLKLCTSSSVTLSSVKCSYCTLSTPHTVTLKLGHDVIMRWSTAPPSKTSGSPTTTSASHTHDTSSYHHWFILRDDGYIISISTKTNKELSYVARKLKQEICIYAIQGVQVPDEKAE